MTQEVRAADSPTLGHMPLPFNSSTTVWIRGCSMCCGYSTRNSDTPAAVVNIIGPASNVENEISPALPTIFVTSHLFAAVKHHEPTPCKHESNRNMPETMSSAEYCHA